MPAAQGMQLIFGHLDPHRGDLHYLMPLWMAIVALQRLTAVPAGGRLEWHDRIHPLHGHKRATVPFVARLAARRTTGGGLLARTFGGRRGGRGRRLPGTAAPSSFAPRQLLLQRRDPRRLLLHHALELIDALPQTDHQHLNRHRRRSPVGVGNRNLRGLFHRSVGVFGYLLPRYQRTANQNSSFSIRPNTAGD